MLNSFKIIIVNLLLITVLFSQSLDQRLTSLIKKYKSFEYSAVIEEAEILIEDSTSLETADLCEIYRLKALAHYSLEDMDGALNSFVALIKLKPDYTLDAEQNSPKVIDFFEEVRQYFSKEKVKSDPQLEIAYNEMYQRMDSIQISQSIMNKSLLYSFLLPGVGHLTREPSTKGWLIFGAGIVTLGGSVYYIIDANQKEKDYLNAIERNEIEYKYSAYNTSYKRRNFFIIAYATVWLFSQIDFLFFSNVKNRTFQYGNFQFNMTPRNQKIITMQISF